MGGAHSVFWLHLLVGFHLTFFPMHILGLWGTPRRIYTQPAELPGWSGLNLYHSLSLDHSHGSVWGFVGLLH